MKIYNNIITNEIFTLANKLLMGIQANPWVISSVIPFIWNLFGTS